MSSSLPCYLTSQWHSWDLNFDYQIINEQDLDLISFSLPEKFIYTELDSFQLHTSSWVFYMAGKGARDFGTKKGIRNGEEAICGIASELLLLLLQNDIWKQVQEKKCICLRFQHLGRSPLCGLGNSNNLLAHLLNKKQEQVISKKIHRLSSPRAGENKILLKDLMREQWLEQGSNGYQLFQGQERGQFG